MSEQRKTEAAQPALGKESFTEAATTGAGSSGELHALSAEVVDLFYAQAFVPGKVSSAGEICQSFTDILLRHWNLCCLIIFLQSDDGYLVENAIHTHPHLDAERALGAAKLLATVVERAEQECQVWLDRAEESDCDEAVRDVRRALEATKLRAGLAVPIRARGGIVGTLVALSSSPDQLRAATRGVRFIAAPIVIAIGNARRAAAMQEQRRQIEQMVEELRRNSAMIEEANIELRRVNRYRSLFLARMSHELRTPLTSVLGFAEILLDHEKLTDTQRRFCEKIQNSGKQLQSSLNQLVDISRIEAGKMELFLHEFSLRETLRESCTAVCRLAQKQEVTLECTPAPELSTVVSDEGKLRQVLYNFLAHAIGRSPAGGHVRVRAHADAKPGPRFSIEIEDEGEPLLDPSHIFEAADVDAPNERGTNMNELGLVIAHRLLGVLGGAVQFESGAERGLTVRLDFPACPKEN